MADPITTYVTERVTGYGITGFHGEIIGTNTLQGADEVMQKIAVALQHMRAEAAGSLYRLAEEMMTESKKRVPVDLGTLRDSGYVSLPDPGAATILTTLGFGGPAGSGNQGGVTNIEDVGYAIIVHEDEEAIHGVGEAKFLESVVREYAPHILSRVAQGIKL